jgi:hypothetical protein
LWAGTLPGQSISRIYVEPFGNNQDSLQEETIRLLKSRKDVQVASSVDNADRVLTGTDQTYIKGYLARNPRVRYKNSDSRPVFGGYVSVELKDRQDETVWSYLVTPRRFGPEDLSKNLAGQIVNKLVEFLANPTKAGP